MPKPAKKILNSKIITTFLESINRLKNRASYRRSNFWYGKVRNATITNILHYYYKNENNIES